MYLKENRYIEKKQIDYVDAIVNHYHYLKRSINYDELFALYNVIYPSDKMKLNMEDWILCDIAVNNNISAKVCERFEIINRRIDIYKNNSFQTSEIFMRKFTEELQSYHENMYGFLEPFCNGKEQGLMLRLVDKQTEEETYFWCFGDNKNNLAIITSNEKTTQNLYFNEDRSLAQYFPKTNEKEAIEYCVDKVTKFLNKDINIKI